MSLRDLFNELYNEYMKQQGLTKSALTREGFIGGILKRRQAYVEFIEIMANEGETEAKKRHPFLYELWHRMNYQ